MLALIFYDNYRLEDLVSKSNHQRHLMKIFLTGFMNNIYSKITNIKTFILILFSITYLNF